MNSKNLAATLALAFFPHLGLGAALGEGMLELLGGK
jgi:hypothetical protein